MKSLEKADLIQKNITPLKNMVILMKRDIILSQKLS